MNVGQNGVDCLFQALLDPIHHLGFGVLIEVRIHDLRHSFASFLMNNGRSLYDVRRILGHTHIRTTQRYAHRSPDTLPEAVEMAGAPLKVAFLE